MSIVFCSPYLNITVFQDKNGSYSWSGQYHGMSIKQAIPFNGGAHCVLLLDPDASNRPKFENLLCIDAKGHSTWNAKLKNSPDVFLDMAINSNGILTHTWSGMMVTLGMDSGMEISSEFTK